MLTRWGSHQRLLQRKYTRSSPVSGVPGIVQHPTEMDSTQLFDSGEEEIEIPRFSA